jgi:iron transport multicopper oxidase
MRLTKSKPPTDAVFTVLDALDEGTTIAAGTSRTVRVRFTPSALGPVSATWILNAADGSGVHEIPLTGTGTTASDDVVGAGATDPAPAPPLVAGGPGTAPVLPVRLRPGLSVSAVRASKDGRRLVVSGRVARAARGAVAVSVTARVGRRVVRIEAGGRLRGASTYRLTLALPRAARRWDRLKVTVRFAGSSAVAPGAGSKVVVRTRKTAGV